MLGMTSMQSKPTADDDFFRFPRTPHIAWLGAGSPRDDKVLSPGEVDALLADEVMVEEKADGANLGLSVGPDGELRAQNRGQYLVAPFTGQFAPLEDWLARHEDALFDALGESLILFGEWCAARHSVAYDALPDWFLPFDVYDRVEQHFWSTTRRDDLAHSVGLSPVPRLMQGRTTLARLMALMETCPSRLGASALEGIVVRAESSAWLRQRAKLVRADFTQQIAEHWSRRIIEWNRRGFDHGHDDRGAHAG
jgi:ATP-dependent RNA circularization protein (DNA/RNA ligase family)